MRNFLIILFISLGFTANSFGHPMPNSVLLLDMQANGINAEVQLPINELEFALDFGIGNNTDVLIERYGSQLSRYLAAHIHAQSPDGTPWTVQIGEMHIEAAEQTATGAYKELVVKVYLQNPQGQSPRHLTLYYDAIIHQVVSHKTLVVIRQDWDNGILAEQQSNVGIIQLDVKSNTILPLSINLDEGSTWTGFKGMVNLGLEHIAEGTDHLLFLLVLLLPATLLVSDKQWAGFGGTRYSIIRLIKMATAFTVGHSITLLLGAMNWVQLPQQPVEIFIAVTILITAIHALRPVFPDKEIYVACGFGLVHGLAFATVLSDLNIGATKMALSILGFNLGIEFMQLFVIILTVPWLIILSQHPAYKWFRITGAIIAIIASFAWMVERITLSPNVIASFIQTIAEQSKWLLLGLVGLAVISWLSRLKGSVGK